MEKATAFFYGGTLVRETVLAVEGRGPLRPPHNNRKKGEQQYDYHTGLDSLGSA